MSSLHGSLDKNIVWGICNFKMVAIFQAGWCLVEHLSDIMVYLAIQAWKLARSVSMGHLTISHPQLLKIPRWRPFFKMADTLVEHLSDIMVYFGIQAWQLAWAVYESHLHGNKPPTATWNFKMAAICQGACRPPFWSLNDTSCHRNVLDSSKGSVKRGCSTVFCLTPHPRPVQFGKTCWELPPTGIALRVHWGTQVHFRYTMWRGEAEP